MVRFSPDLGIGAAYVMNRLGCRMAMNDPRPNRLLDATLACAKKLLKK